VFRVSTSFQLDRGRIDRMLHLPGGMVHRNMERRVRRVEAEAKRRAPGSMGDGIRSRLDRTAAGDFRGVITSTHPATIYVVSGTRPHVIRPVRARALRFTVGGRVVFATVVHHPGTRANNFLAEALRAAL
jgi:hypothetical protein